MQFYTDDDIVPNDNFLNSIDMIYFVISDIRQLNLPTNDDIVMYNNPNYNFPVGNVVKTNFSDHTNRWLLIYTNEQHPFSLTGRCVDNGYFSFPFTTIGELKSAICYAIDNYPDSTYYSL